MLLGVIPARYEVPEDDFGPAPVLRVLGPEELGSAEGDLVGVPVLDLLDPEGVTLASVEVEQLTNGFVA